MILNQNSEYAALLDACVIVPMPLCDTLLRLAEHPALYRPLWSEGILAEAGRILTGKLHLTPQQAVRRLDAMREAFPEALVKVPPRLLETLDCPDANDRHVLAAAVRGQANVIVTDNRRDFPEECRAEYGILCETPDDFLIHQFHLNPALVFEKLDQQGATIRQTRADIIQRLEKPTPQFAKLLRSYLVS
jgi:predicted nucleic acid-binding protein